MGERHEVTTRPVVYAVPAQAAVAVRRDLPYASASGETLTFDLYSPAEDGRSGPRPAVLFVTGYDDAGMQAVLGCKAKEMASYDSWGRLVAAHGMAGITYECRRPADDARAVLAHLRRDGAALSIDPARVAVWSCSGNVPNAVHLVMDDPSLAGAAWLYGYTLDLDGLTGVADAAATFRFVTPAAGRAVEDLPRDTPILVVRAGGDQTAGLNPALDRFVAHALAANRPVTVLNHHTGAHAFDIMEPTAGSRAAVAAVLRFLQMVTSPGPA